MKHVAVAFLVLAVACGLASAEPIKYQITGLFSPDRVADLKEAMEDLPQIKLVSVDYKNAEATFDFDAKKVFPGANEKQVMERLENLLRPASRHTMGLKPARTVPLEKLTFVEIAVEGLDCKACSLAAYESIYKLDGVERATASFKEGLVTAHIDPAKTDRAKLEDALKKRGVTLKKTP